MKKKSTMNHEIYMQYAFDEAFYGMHNNHGGPFGAIIVSDGNIIGKGHNMVTLMNDPTAHAEIVAIREACKTKNSFYLHNTVLYATCEPCPMCLAAIYWANIKTVFYCYDRIDAANIGFDDNFIYKEINMPINQRRLNMNKIPFLNNLFNEWSQKQDRTHY
jgi:tRNA(Arg) A34 adenosine deaminase TadA